jgi:hypothetical protein
MHGRNYISIAVILSQSECTGICRSCPNATLASSVCGKYRIRNTKNLSPKNQYTDYVFFSRKISYWARLNVIQGKYTLWTMGSDNVWLTKFTMCETSSLSPKNINKVQWRATRTLDKREGRIRYHGGVSILWWPIIPAVSPWSNVKFIRYQFWCTRCAFRQLKCLQW